MAPGRERRQWGRSDEIYPGRDGQCDRDGTGSGAAFIDDFEFDDGLSADFHATNDFGGTNGEARTERVDADIDGDSERCALSGGGAQENDAFGDAGAVRGDGE